jgi:hypothetical protein
MRHALVRNPLLNILECFFVMLIYVFQRKIRVSWIIKLKSVFIGYKDGTKDNKLWSPETKKVVYNWDVVFREVKDVPKQEVPPKEKEPKTIEFESEG